MAIRDLHDGAGTIVSGLHPRVAVVPVGPEGGQRARAALAEAPGVRFVGSAAQQPAGACADAGAREAQTVAELEARLGRFLQDRDRAGEALVEAVSGVEAALGALDEFDQAERELGRALLLRDRATAAESLEARRLAEVLERRVRLTEQRQDAMRVIEQIEMGGPVRRSAELRRQIADMEAGLARAEAEQTRAERAAEATLHQARESRLAAAAELERADRVLRADLPGLPGVSAQEWPPGPPLPVLVAERRDRIAAVLAERYQARTAANAAMDEAGEGRRAAERELAGIRATTSTLGDAAALERVLADHAGPGTTVVCDEPLAGPDLSVFTSVVEQVAGATGAQVVILTGDDAILAWAADLAPEVGAITAPAGEPDQSGGPTGEVAFEGRPPATITPLRLAAPDHPSPLPAHPAPSRSAAPAPSPGPGGGTGNLRAAEPPARLSSPFEEALRHVSTYP
ncbi:MAG: hypothetical protein M0Z30_10305 [Actinomycetota bacterium]|nr:hypothetical protein [Actinomycetota bacterium]